MKPILLISFLMLAMAASAQKYYLLIGTYTTGTSKGIYVYRFDDSTGKAEQVSVADGVDNPSYLTLSADGQNVYAVNENGGKTAGAVSAFSFDTVSGQLHFINKQLSGGDYPCYVSIDRTKKWVIVANYGGGNLSAFPVNATGGLQAAAQTIQHEGVGYNPKRQEKAHAHSTFFTPDQEFLFCTDLGLDRIYSYDFHADQDQPLSPSRPPFTSTPKGSGPRHAAFSADHRYMYLLEELSGNVQVYAYDKGILKAVQTIASVIKDTSADKGSADIHLSPDGKFLYTSNRGITNNISIYEVHPSTGKLKFLGVQDAGGVMPRNFSIDPSGRFLLVANQKSANVVVFKRDAHTGLLTPTGVQIQVDQPVCLKWWPIR
jgi:6-phosphogluconolactonase